MSTKSTRFEKLLEAVPDALVGMDQKGVIRFVNRETEALFGFDRADLVGEPIETLVPEPLWQVYAQHKEDYFEDPRTRSSALELELVGRRSSGDDFPINVSMSHIDTGDVLLVITGVRDVDERSKAIKSAQITASIVESSNDAILGGGLDGIIRMWNPAAERMYGYSSREIIGKSGSLLTPKDHAGELDALLAVIAQGRSVEQLETMLVRKNGTLIPVSINIAPIRDEDGVIVGASAVHRDVTHQRQAFEATQRMAAIVENSGDAIISSTLEGIVTSWNKAAESLFGYSAKEVIGASVETISAISQPDEMKSILAKVKAGRHIEHLETIRVHKDGTVFPVSLTVSPIRDADGAISGTSMISRDMTEMKHAARYARSLLEAALDPLVTISPGGKINDVNEATVKATGLPRRSLVGTDFSHYFTDPEKAHDGYRQAFAQGSITDYPLTLRHRNGTLTEVLYNASVYRDFNDKPVGVFAAARDVTAQKQALEDAQRMAAIVENSAEAIISLTLDSTIMSWNPAAERMSGYTSEEVVGMPCDFIHPQDKSGEMQTLVAQIMAGLPVKDYRTERIRKDGSVLPIALSLSPIPDDNGTVIGVSLIARDLTAERQASETAQRMAAIVKYSDDAIISRTIDGVIQSWNPAAERTFGYTSEEIVGKSIDLLIPQDRAAETSLTVAKIRAGQALSNVETVRLRKDGSPVTVSLTLSPIRDESGTVVAASGIFRDVTDQHEVFAAAQRMAAIVEHSSDAIIGFTLDGVITNWNPAAERLYGYPSDRIVGKSVDLLSPKGRASEFKEILVQISEGQSAKSLETICRRKDRTTFPVKLAVAPISDPNGAIIGASAIVRDVTLQRRVLAAAQQMAAIVEFSGEAIFSCTLDEIITTWNPAAEDLYGYSRDEITGKSGSLLTPKGRPDEIKALLSTVRDGEIVADYESLSVRKGGTVFPVSLTLSPIRGVDDTIIGVAAVAHDLTRHK